MASAAARLLRAYATQVEALRRLRHGGSQTMRVEHVHVNDGGQALIGNVSSERQVEALRRLLCGACAMAALRLSARTSRTPLTDSTQFSVTAFRGTPGHKKDCGKPDDGNYIVRYHNQITHGRTALIALRHNAAGTVNEALALVDSLFSEEDLQPGLGAVEKPRLVRRGLVSAGPDQFVSPSNRRRESSLRKG